MMSVSSGQRRSKRREQFVETAASCAYNPPAKVVSASSVPEKRKKIDMNQTSDSEDVKSSSMSDVISAPSPAPATASSSVQIDINVHPRLTHSDFTKPSLELSRYLLGKILVRIYNGEILAGRIVETEAYLGEVDKACHTYNGKRTNRTEPMYMTEGTSYVYSIYGMYYCLNVSSSTVGGCTLIRALEAITGMETMNNLRDAKKSPLKKRKLHELCSGPSKLCLALHITKDELNSVDMSTSKDFYIVDDGYVCKEIVECKRIGIDGYGVEWVSKPYRFYEKYNKCVSVRNKAAENPQ